jgi:hypothetical protein
MDRIETWMKDIVACHDEGYSGRCENAYGPPEPGDRRGALDTLQTLPALRAAFADTDEGRPVPCHSAELAEIRDRERTESVSEVQLRALFRSTDALCEDLGVDRESLADAHRTLLLELRRLEARLLSNLRSRREALALILHQASAMAPR